MSLFEAPDLLDPKIVDEWVKTGNELLLADSLYNELHLSCVALEPEDTIGAMRLAILIRDRGRTDLPNSTDNIHA